MKQKITTYILTAILTWLCLFGSLHVISVLRGLHPKLELIYVVKTFLFFVIIGIISGSMAIFIKYPSILFEIIANFIIIMLCGFIAGSIIETAESGVNVFFAVLSIVVTMVFISFLFLVRKVIK